MKEFMKKVERARKVLESKGCYDLSPPLWRLFWRLGYEIPPPIFQPGKSSAIQGSLFYVSFVVFFLFTGGYIGSFILAAPLGVLFGLYMYFSLKNKSTKMKLPSWDEIDANYSD